MKTGAIFSAGCPFRSLKPKFVISFFLLFESLKNLKGKPRGESMDRGQNVWRSGGQRGMVTRRVVSPLQTTTPHGATHGAAGEEVPSAPGRATGMGCGGLLVRADLRVWRQPQHAEDDELLSASGKRTDRGTQSPRARELPCVGAQGWTEEGSEMGSVSLRGERGDSLLLFTAT